MFDRNAWRDGMTAASGMAMVAVLIATIFILICIEIAKVYVSHIRSQFAGVLWGALACLLVLWVIAYVMVSSGGSQVALGAYLAAWSFLGFVIVVEGVDLVARRKQREMVEQGESLDSYLSPFSPNGNPAAAGARGRS